MSQFDFVFRFGVGSKNEFNIWNNTVTKGLVLNPPQTLDLKLTFAEKQQVYNKLKQMHFMEMTDKDACQCPHPIPADDCQLTVTMDGLTKKLVWQSLGTNIADPKLDTCNRLVGLELLILSVLRNRDEYKKAKPIRGGYL